MLLFADRPDEAYDMCAKYAPDCQYSTDAAYYSTFSTIGVHGAQNASYFTSNRSLYNSFTTDRPESTEFSTQDSHYFEESNEISQEEFNRTFNGYGYDEEEGQESRVDMTGNNTTPTV